MTRGKLIGSDDKPQYPNGDADDDYPLPDRSFDWIAIAHRWHRAVNEMARDRPADLVLYLVKRLLLTPRDQPLLFADRLNDVDVALWEYEREHGRIATDVPEEATNAR